MIIWGVACGQVDMFRGTLNNNIPIHTFKGREMDLPISLNYTTTGIKVDQVASNVGLGWNLNVGGKISRVAVGKPDGHRVTSSTQVGGGICINSPSGDGYLNQGMIRDYYKVNALGFDDIFRFTSNVIMASLINPKREYTINNTDATGRNGEFSITAEDGTIFYFGQNGTRELSITSSIADGCSVTDDISTTTWMLTKVVSKNKLDEYSFTYQNFDWTSSVSNNGEGESVGGVLKLKSSNYKLKEKMITEIYHNGVKIVGFTYTNRDDLNFVGGAGNALSEIQFFNFNSTVAYSKVNFNYSYFGNLASTNFLDKRLKLDELVFSGIDATGIATAGDKYGFEYINPAGVPSLTSYARDYLGLYNGKNANTNLVYNGNVYEGFPPSYVCNPPNSNRSFNINHALNGTLNKIIYPSKGYSVFEYEQNALKGGYGTTYTIDFPYSYNHHFTNTNDSQEVALNINAEMCSDVPQQYTALHPLMQSVFISNFAECPSSLLSAHPFHGINAKSIIFNVSGTTSAQNPTGATQVTIETAGIGVYLIQKINNVSISSVPKFTYPRCEYASNGTNTYPVMPLSEYVNSQLNSNTIFCNSNTSHSYPNDYIIGGLTMTDNGSTNLNWAILEPGTYQITVWKFTESGNNYPRVNITKGINGFTWMNAHFQNNDQISDLMDGFRVKSVTNHTSNSQISNKKNYKYCNPDNPDYVKVTSKNPKFHFQDNLCQF